MAQVANMNTIEQAAILFGIWVLLDALVAALCFWPRTEDQ